MEKASVEKKLNAAAQELPAKFVPTPEKVSGFLNQREDEIVVQLESVEGRKKIFDTLVEREADIKKLDPSFDSADLKHQLDLVGDTLTQKKKFMEDVKSPEKQGFLRRSFNRVKNFAKNHPVASLLLVLALAAAGIGGAAYLAGGIEALLAKVGISHLAAASSAAEPLGSVVAPGVVPPLIVPGSM